MAIKKLPVNLMVWKLLNQNQIHTHIVWEFAPLGIL